MKFIADLHIHSHYSRATSRNLNPENLALWAQKKGISIVGTGDFTHPGWISELQEKIIETGNGLYRLKPDLCDSIQVQVPKSCRDFTMFILSVEISCIYKKDGKTRKNHHLILMPDFDSAIKLNRKLDSIGNIKSDGRPILGLDSRNLLEMVLESSDRAFFIPAHIWTPWFSVFGSKSGFDSLEECFGDLTPYIHALETGLSSDPPMNRLISSLDDYLLVSNSDAHSPPKLGREANIFDTDPDYDKMIKAMTTKAGFAGTIEFYPEEGKYHLDGHRKCQVRLTPKETRECKGICPKCGKPLTVGVFHRIAELADREAPKLSKEFTSLIPLTEILSEILSCGPATKTVDDQYEGLLSFLGPELKILMDVPLADIESAGGVLLATAIDRMRKGHVIKQEGYDGEFGKIRLFHESEKAELAGQSSFFKTRGQGKTAPQRRLSSNGLKVKAEKKSLDTEQSSLPDPILDVLNKEQREAVVHNGGHLLIVAGPGTGKTMTLTHRIAHAIRSNMARPEQILALTFTNKAALEMAKRLELLLSRQVSERVKTATYHSFCLEILRNESDKLNPPGDFNLCPEEDSSFFAEQSVLESGKGTRAASSFKKKLPDLKFASVSKGDPHPPDNEMMDFYLKYKEKLNSLMMLDLDDLIIETIRLLKDFPEIRLRYARMFPWIFVDEYQDTNPAQAAFLKLVVREGLSEICAIGDPDQAIYGFRGADLKNFYRFRQDFPGAREIRLQKNYRSTQTILDGASSLIGQERPLIGNNGKGSLITIAGCETCSEEAEMIIEQIEKMIGGISHFSIDSGRVSSYEDGNDICFGDIAVLFRLNAQGNALEEAFSRAGIPYIRSGEKSLISQYPVNIIYRCLQALVNPEVKFFRDAYGRLLEGSDISANEALRTMKLEDDLNLNISQAISIHKFDLSSDESNDTILRLRDLAERHDGDVKTFLDRLTLDRGIDHSRLSGDRVALMSLHAGKGLEWPIVFITGCEDRLVPCSLFGDMDIPEEKRLFYVGMTRAGLNLILSFVKKRSMNGRVLEMGPSPFLDLIPRELIKPLDRNSWKPKAKKHKQLELF
jgi:DNA helicase-2/ATP-dependent DNA helicase PcrA